jgi:ABC-type antimicrobial peptide transport system permease subunit
MTKRVHEFGLRTALGAQRCGILHLALRDELFVALIGIGVGFAGASALHPLFANQLYGVAFRPADSYFIGVLFVAATLIATYIPRHATKIDPMQALRHD